MMTDILSNFFDVSFYTFTHFVVYNKLQALLYLITLQILSKIHDETQKTVTIKIKHT
jgi:hypothetical protein